jgi:valyl-tRNA synthetase
MGWSNDRKSSLQRIYPTDMLETGYDIMFFWALRMAGMCHALSGQLPYRQILFHGLVNDSQGRKMSKSIGNVIDPIDLIDGASLQELKDRIVSSNLSTQEKNASIKYQEKQFPNGIEAVGCDATRLGLLVQDFKSKLFRTICSISLNIRNLKLSLGDSINIDINIFGDSKRLCNKIWQAVRYSEMSVDGEKKKHFKTKTLNEVIHFSNFLLKF